MMINHINCPDEDLQIYCRMKNEIVTYSRAFADSKCSECPSFYGSSVERGIECIWEDDMEGVTNNMVVENPYEEYKRVNVTVKEKNNLFYKEQKDFVKKNKVPKGIMALREQIKSCKSCTEAKGGNKAYLVNPFDVFKDEEYLQPYTTNYWTDQCFNNPADIAIVGQDWETVPSVWEYNRNGRTGQENEIRKNLEDGINHIGCRDRTVFINSVMCLLEGKYSKGDNFQYNFISKCKNIVVKHLDIVKPKIVVTMGKGVTQRYIDNVKRTDTFYSLVSRPYWNPEKQWFAFPMYLLGVKGKLSRQRFKDKVEEGSSDFLTDFKLVKWLLISYYTGLIVKDIQDNPNKIDMLEEQLLRVFPHYTEEAGEMQSLVGSRADMKGILGVKSFQDTVLYIYNAAADAFVLKKEESTAL